MNDDLSWGELLEATRYANGLSQLSAARLMTSLGVNVGQPRFSQWESGKERPTRSRFAALRRLFPSLPEPPSYAIEGDFGTRIGELGNAARWDPNYVSPPRLIRVFPMGRSGHRPDPEVIVG